MEIDRVIVVSISPSKFPKMWIPIMIR